jgi:hypothetical protein
MKTNNNYQHYYGDFGVSKKVFNKAKRICQRLIKEHGIPENQIEINEDCTVHFYLISEDERTLHFEITVDEGDVLEYWCISIEGKDYSLNYGGCIEESIDYLDEFMERCYSEEIFEEFEGTT